LGTSNRARNLDPVNGLDVGISKPPIHVMRLGPVDPTPGCMDFGLSIQNRINNMSEYYLQTTDRPSCVARSTMKIWAGQDLCDPQYVAHESKSRADRSLRHRTRQ
jgi:hypothetical protein